MMSTVSPVMRAVRTCGSSRLGRGGGYCARSQRGSDRAHAEPPPRTVAPGSPAVTTLAARVAVVTGAGSGLGRASALALATAGAAVVASDVDLAAAEATAAVIASRGGVARARRTDVADPAQCE